MKTVNTLMLKLSLAASIFFAVEIIIFYMVSNYYGVETAVTVALAGAITLALTGTGVGALTRAGMLALAGAEMLALTLAGVGAGMLAVTLALAGAEMLAVTLAGVGALVLVLALGESKNKVSLWKTFFFILLMEVFMGVGVFMIIKNIPMGMFAISFAYLFPILISGCDFVLQFNGEGGLFTKKEEVAEVAEMQVS